MRVVFAWPSKGVAISKYRNHTVIRVVTSGTFLYFLLTGKSKKKIART